MDRENKVCIGKDSCGKWLFSMPFRNRASVDDSAWHGSLYETFQDAVERLNINIRARDSWAAAERLHHV